MLRRFTVSVSLAIFFYRFIFHFYSPFVFGSSASTVSGVRNIGLRPYDFKFSTRQIQFFYAAFFASHRFPYRVENADKSVCRLMTLSYFMFFKKYFVRHAFQFASFRSRAEYFGANAFTVFIRTFEHFCYIGSRKIKKARVSRAFFTGISIISFLRLRLLP